MSQIRPETERVDPATGQTLIDTDTGETIVMDAAGLMAPTPYAGMPSGPLPKATPQPPPPASGLEHVTAGVLGTDVATLRGTGLPSATTIAPPTSPAAPTAPIEPVPIPVPPPAPPPTEASSGVAVPLSETVKLMKQRAQTEVELGQIQAKQEAIKTEAMENQALLLQQQAQETMEAQARQQAEAQALKERHETALKKYESMEVDSGRLWANKSTGNKILSAIALALGAYAQVGGATKTNPALDMLQHQIDQDIKIQESNIAKAGHVADKYRGMYSDLLAEFKDRDIARAATHKMVLDKAAAQFDALAQKHQGTAVEKLARAKQQDFLIKASEYQDQLNLRFAELARKSDKPLTGTKYDQHTDEKLGTPLGSIKAADALKQLLKDPAVRNNMGIFKGRVTNLMQQMGLPVDPKIVDAKTQMDVMRLSFAKFFSGTGQGVKEREEFLNMSANILDNPENAEAKINGFRNRAVLDYTNAYQTEVSRYNDPTAITTSFPSPASLGAVEEKKQKYGASKSAK